MEKVIESASGSYRAALVALFLLWLVHLSGAIYDAYSNVGGSASLWVSPCVSGGGLCVRDIKSDTQDYHGVMVGDVILKMGGVSSLPTDHIEFRHASSSRFDGTIVVRRAGERLTFTIPVPQYAFQALIATKDLVLGLLAIVIALFSKPSRLALAMIAMFFLVGSSGEGAPIGPSSTTAYVLVAVNVTSQLILWPAVAMTLLLLLKPEVDRGPLLACWAFAIFGCLLAMIYYELPFQPNAVRNIYLAGFLLMLTIFGGMALRLYPKTCLLYTSPSPRDS